MGEQHITIEKLLLKIMNPEGSDANSRQVAILLAVLSTLVFGVILVVIYSAMHILQPVEPKPFSNAPEVKIVPRIEMVKPAEKAPSDWPDKPKPVTP